MTFTYLARQIGAAAARNRTSGPVWRAGAALVIGNNIADEVLLVDDLALDGKVFCEEWHSFAGGQAANVAATLARLGLPTVFLGRFGGDEAGAFTRSALQSAGVEVPTTGPLSGHTMSAIVAVDRTRAQRTIVMRRDPALMKAPLPVEAIDLDNIGVLYGDGYERATFIQLARKMRAAGRPVVTDLEQSGPDDDRLIELVTHLVAPAEVLCAIAGESDEAAAIRRLARQGPAVVVATRGKNGAIGTDGGDPVAVPATSCVVADTTGAGDAFHAGFLVAMRRGLDLERTISFANQIAAVKCATPGPQATREALAPFRWVQA